MTVSLRVIVYEGIMCTCTYALFSICWPSKLFALASRCPPTTHHYPDWSQRCVTQAEPAKQLIGRSTSGLKRRDQSMRRTHLSRPRRWRVGGATGAFAMPNTDPAHPSCLHLPNGQSLFAVGRRILKYVGGRLKRTR